MSPFMSLEVDHLVQTDMVTDSYEKSQSINIGPNSNGPVDIQRNDVDIGAENPFLLPPFSQIRQVLEMVEGLTYRCNFPDAMYFLRKAKEAFFKAKMSATPDCHRQKFRTEMPK